MGGIRGSEELRPQVLILVGKGCWGGSVMNWKTKLQGWSEEKRLWLLFLACCLVLGIFLVPRAFLGFNTADEMYFAGTVERIYRGERILIDEWHPSQQLSAFCIYPLYFLLRKILGSTEGIIMAVRLTALALHFLAAVISFGRLKKKGLGALGAVLLFLIYVPFSLTTLSYNSIQFTVLFVLASCLYGKSSHRAWEYVLYGVLWALLVLANPFALILYGIYGLLCLGFTLWGKKKHREIEEILRLRSFLLTSLGAAFVAVLFAAFVLGRGSIEEIQANLPYILGDSEHEQEGIRTYIKKTGRYFYLCYKNYKYMIVGFGALFLAMLADKKRQIHRAVYLGIGVLCLAPYLVYYGFLFGHIPVNYQMLPLAFLGLEAYILTKDRDRRLFYCGYVPAALFTMIVQYATNTGIVTISAAYGLCSMFSVILIWDCGREIHASHSMSAKSRNVAVGFLALALALQFAGTFYLRMSFAWGDDKTWRLDTRMERGPLKGVYTVKEQAEEYNTVLRELDGLELTEEDELLVVGVAPWIYLYTDAGCGSYSTWQVHEGSTQLTDYYALHPDKFPTVVYMMHWGEDFMGCALADPFKERGYEVLYLERGIVMQAPGRGM